MAPPRPAAAGNRGPRSLAGIAPLTDTAAGRDAPGAAAQRPRPDTPGAQDSSLEPQEAGRSEGDLAFGGRGGRGAPFLHRVWLEQRGYGPAAGPARPPPFQGHQAALLPPRELAGCGFCSNVSPNDAKTPPGSARHAEPGGSLPFRVFRGPPLIPQPRRSKDGASAPSWTWKSSVRIKRHKNAQFNPTRCSSLATCICAIGFKLLIRCTGLNAELISACPGNANPCQCWLC